MIQLSYETTKLTSPPPQNRGMTEKLFKGGGGEAMDMFDEDSVAMKSLLDGGGKPLEMLQVALGFLQVRTLFAFFERLDLILTRRLHPSPSLS